METAEEFFRTKIKEQHHSGKEVTLATEVITAEQGMRWAHQYATKLSSSQEVLKLQNKINELQELINGTVPILEQYLKSKGAF